MARHFPAFPLEARSEVFFALFLPTVLEAHFKKDDVKIKPQVIPQFPLKKEDSNQSNNVDFFALSDGGECAFLIELKTDMNSWRKEQDCYLRRAKRKGMQGILQDLRTIAGVERTESARRKYYHLLQAIAEFDLIKLDLNLDDRMYGHSTGVYDAIGKTKMLKSPHLEVVYVQPRKPECKDKQCLVEGFNYIYFDEFADIVESQGDMGGLFAGYLREWANDPATNPPSKSTSSKV